MKSSLINQVSGILAITAFGILSAFAAPYEKGQKVEPFKAEDQHGAAFSFEPESTQYVLVSHDMETGKKANAVLTGLGNGGLPGKKAIYLANIHGMPGIGRMFAIPKMKKYSHRIILGDDADLIAKFPQQAGKVTVLKLTSGKIQSIRYWTPGTDAIDGYLN